MYRRLIHLQTTWAHGRLPDRPSPEQGTTPARRASAYGLRLMWLLTRAVVLMLLMTSAAMASLNINVEAVQKSVVFLYSSDPTGSVDSSKPLGTGFMVEVPSLSHPDRAYHFLVTARHIFDPAWAGCGASDPTVIFARINLKPYDPASHGVGTTFVRIDLTDQKGPIWTHHNESDVDAAIIPLNPLNLPKGQELDWSSIRVADFPTPGELNTLQVGDAVLSAGLIVPLAGLKRNYPIFKFGQISSIPQEDLEIPCANGHPGLTVKEWLIAANLVPGNSGSPILRVPFGANGIVLGEGRPVLLGLQSVSYLGTDVAGMTPINYVYEILESLKLPDGNLDRGPTPPR